MRSSPVVVGVLAVIFTLAAPANFVVQTVLSDQLSASTMTAALAATVFVMVTVVTGVAKRAELAALGWSGAATAAVGGVLGVFASQYLVLAHRYSDAPPGTEVIFLTTACWGVLLVVAAIVGRRRPSASQVASAAVVLFAVAALLANWERPSSFSPFVRYSSDEVWMLVAGMGWVAFSLIVSGLGRRHRLRVFLPIATGAAAVVSLVFALIGPGRVELLSQSAETWLQLFIAAAAFSAMIVSWTWLVGSIGPVSSSALLFLPAVSLTILGVFERQAGLAGPSPLLWRAATWASAAAIAGAMGVAFLRRGPSTRDLSPGSETEHLTGPESRPSRVGRWLLVGSAVSSVAAAISAVITLWMPALSATVVGSRTSGARYAASWTMSGAETPAGWIALFAALLALTTALALLRRPSGSLRAVLAAGCSAVSLTAVPWLLDTPIRTWTRWVPVEVQQDYGTEYARLTFARAYGPSATLTLILAGLAVVLLAIGAVSTLRRSASTPTTNGRD